MTGVGGTFQRAACLGAAVALLAACSSSKHVTYVTPTTGARSTAKPAGPFKEIAHGTDDGLSWKLSEAGGPAGTTCFKLETAPTVDLIQSDVECPPTPNPNAGDDFNTEFPFETGAKTDHDIVVGVVRKPLKSAEFQFVDGPNAKPKFLDKKRGIVVWAGKSRPFVGSVALTLEDGFDLGCGPGDIQSAEDLGGKPEKQLLDARRFVWTCINQ